MGAHFINYLNFEKNRKPYVPLRQKSSTWGHHRFKQHVNFTARKKMGIFLLKITISGS